MMNKKYAIGADIGGSHISCALVDLQERCIVEQSHSEKKIDNKASAKTILNDWAEAIKSTISKTEKDKIAGIGFAMPGPFSYDKGIALFDDKVAKFESLFGVNVANELKKRLGLDKETPICFMNDASAFAVGETWVGAASDAEKCLSITLGTGFGSAFTINGLPIVEGDGIPPMGCLWHIPFKDGIAEEYFSTRWFIKRWNKISKEDVSGVKDLANEAAFCGDAKSVFIEFGENLGRFLGPWLKNFQAELLVMGGNVTGAAHLYGSAFDASLKTQGVVTQSVTSQLKEDAAIIGSARMTNSSYFEKLLPTLSKM